MRSKRVKVQVDGDLRVWMSFEDGWVHAIFEDEHVVVRWDAPPGSNWFDDIVAVRDGDGVTATILAAAMREQAYEEVAVVA